MQISGRFRAVWVVLSLVAALVALVLIFRGPSRDEAEALPAPAAAPPGARRPFPKAVTTILEDRPHRAARQPNQLPVPDPRLDNGQGE
jgi:hypothetical protein